MRIGGYWAYRATDGADGDLTMAHPRTSAHASLYPPAAWRRLAATQSKGEAAFEAELQRLLQHDGPDDAALASELVYLSGELYDQLVGRGHRLLALGRLVPQSRDEHDALARAGLTWADTGLPEGFQFHGQWLPSDLDEARRLLAWLLARPPSLPRADRSDLALTES